ncbi:MAG: hypothetical protein HRT86_02545 [Ilumatobacteraceae bacterium]|nr:hypothetical protein [Ilumatobacteraceae bacterium]
MTARRVDRLLAMLLAAALPTLVVFEFLPGGPTDATPTSSSGSAVSGVVGVVAAAWWVSARHRRNSRTGWGPGSVLRLGVERSTVAPTVIATANMAKGEQ